MAKTIYQGMDIPFHHVDVKDCLILHELMDDLVDGINAFNVEQKVDKLPVEEWKNYRAQMHSICISNHKAEAIYNVLASLGFVSTKDVIPIDDINLDDYRKK